MKNRQAHTVSWQNKERIHTHTHTATCQYIMATSSKQFTHTHTYTHMHVNTEGLQIPRKICDQILQIGKQQMWLCP